MLAVVCEHWQIQQWMNLEGAEMRKVLVCENIFRMLKFEGIWAETDLAGIFKAILGMIHDDSTGEWAAAR